MFNIVDNLERRAHEIHRDIATIEDEIKDSFEQIRQARRIVRRVTSELIDLESIIATLKVSTDADPR